MCLLNILIIDNDYFREMVYKSTDIAPDIQNIFITMFLFQNVKKDIREIHFWSDEEVVTAVEEWVNGKDPDFFSSSH